MTDEVAGKPATVHLADQASTTAQNSSITPARVDGHGSNHISSTCPSLAHVPLSQPSTVSPSVDQATTTFIRRTLCAHHLHSTTASKPPPFDALLPPLTSSNAVDVELYAFIAIIIKDCVYTWYSRITSDHVFVDEVVHIIAHCTRALEERIRKLNIESLLLDEIPALLDVHVNGTVEISASDRKKPAYL